MSVRGSSSDGPDFVGVGVQKCGTTWLSARLAEHEQVFFNKKEISFFTNHFYRGYDWYHSHFADKGERVSGDVSPNYFISPRPNSTRLEHYPRWSLQSWWKHLTRPYPAARDELKKSYADVRVFAVFRNPIDRAWSHYWMWHERKKKTGKPHLVVPFETMFADNGRWIRLTGEYGRLLRYWRDAFPDMGVFLYDDLVADPEAFIKSVYRFIGVDDTFVGQLGRRENAREYEDMPGPIRNLLREAYREEIEDFCRQIDRQLPWLD
jgi:hypothetical protein